jgi:hypothetical protein
MFGSRRPSSARFAEDFASGFKHLLARLARFNGSYLRFTGNVQLEHFVNGKLVEDVSNTGIWEMMYFGRVYRRSHLITSASAAPPHQLTPHAMRSRGDLARQGALHRCSTT